MSTKPRSESAVEIAPQQLPPLQLLPSVQVGVSEEELLRDFQGTLPRLEARRTESTEPPAGHNLSRSPDDASIVILRVTGLKYSKNEDRYSQWLANQFVSRWGVDQNSVWQKPSYVNNHICSNPSASYFEVVFMTKRGLTRDEKRANLLSPYTMADFMLRLLTTPEMEQEGRNPFEDGVDMSSMSSMPAGRTVLNFNAVEGEQSDGRASYQISVR